MLQMCWYYTKYPLISHYTIRFMTLVGCAMYNIRVVFSVARMRSSNSARMNKLDFTTEKIGSVHMTVFEIVAHRNVDNWTQLLK